MAKRAHELDLHGGFKCATGTERRGASYIWLLYASFFLIEPAIRKNAIYWAECLGVLAIFVGSYVWYVETRDRRVRLPIIGCMVLLGLATIHFNAGASFLFIFAAALVPFVVGSMRTAFMLIGADALLVIASWAYYRDNPINYSIAATFVMVVGVANLFVAEQKRGDVRLRFAQEENAALAALAERERIARDLHDVLGHTLSVIVLKAELAGRLMGRDDARAASEIADVERTARTALAEVREAIGGYRAKGLRAEVDQARMTLDAAGVTLLAETPPPVLKAQEETALSLAVREAVTNIVRHAGASVCTLRFSTAADGFTRLEVEDDGGKPIEREGNGLRGMRARVEELGGRLRIERASEPRPGTRLVIELPGTALAAAGKN